MKDLFVDSEKFRLGFYALEDTTKAPFGSARVMKNIQVTDRGGIAPRLGTKLIGNQSSSTAQTDGFYNYIKSFAQDEILVRISNGVKEGLSKRLSSSNWFTIKSGYTPGKDWGFVNSLVNTDNQDYLIGGNRYEPFERWSGALAVVSANVTAGATSIPVDTILMPDTLFTGVVSSATTTSVVASASTYADNQWNNFYIHFTSGTYVNQVRKIATTIASTKTLTFSALAGTPTAGDTFEIRQLIFPESGSLLINGTSVPYTAVPNDQTFTVASAPAISAGTVLTLEVETFPQNPRGNRFANYLGRIMVDRVRSALARDAGGALQGYAAAGSYYVSKVNNPVDFTYAAARVAGEGDIVAAPYGGDDFTDIIAQEDKVYAFKPEYIEAASYTQDTKDLIQREPLKPGFGSVGRVLRGSDDLYFVTKDKQITSIGRVQSKDITVQSENMGITIKRFIDPMDFTNMNGGEYQNRLLFNGKSTTTASYNDIVVVYNKVNKSFDGIWDIAAFGFTKWNNKYTYAESTGPNVYEMFVGHSDVVGTTRFPIAAEYATHFMNLTPSKSRVQGLSGLFFEGYIEGNSIITFKAWKQFENDPFLQFDFSGTETTKLDGSISSAFLGGQPFGLSPFGSVSDPDSDGRRHFSFTIYFPPQYANFFSIGWESSGVDYNWEITRYAMLLTEDISSYGSRVKTV